MAEQDGQEKTEQPTGKKLKDGREKGQVAKSVEINSLAIFTSGLMLLLVTQNFISSRMSGFSKHYFGNLDVLTISKSMIQTFTKDQALFYFITLAPILGGLFLIGFIASAAQVGVKFSLKALTPKFSKLNPITGLKNVFASVNSLVELLKSALKLVVIGILSYITISKFILQSTSLVTLTVPDIVHFMIEAAFTLLWRIALLYAVLAAADFIYQKVKFKKDMMMTKQEVKEENKQSEGDPKIKSRIREIQYKTARNRMMQDVPKADVVITNPTHFAIAIKYDMEKDAAPRVLAKGADKVAQKIKEIARQNNIPLQENRELARALYKICDIGDQIPETLFKAVAQVLAYVYQLKNSNKKNSIV